MNFTQLHERLRIEVRHRIERGILTSALLARQTGLTSSHLSNFLNRKRMLSLAALDKVLAALSLPVTSLSTEAGASSRGTNRQISAMQYESVPLVDDYTAIFEARVSARSTLSMVKVGSELLENLRDKCPSPRRNNWDRCVAIAITDQHALGMQPVLVPGMLVLVDRHYTAAVEYSQSRRTLYAVRHASQLRFRYVNLVGRLLVMNPHQHTLKPDVIELQPGQAPADLLVGRAFLIIAEI